MGFPIETERLLIRPFELSDAEEIQALWSDPETMRWIPSGTVDSVEAARAKVGRFMAHQAEHGFSLWVVREKATGRIVGDCGLLLVEWKGPEVELAYRFGKEFWGRGYASEAAGACLRYGFEQLGLTRVIAITDPDHSASRRVMEKNGLRLEGMAYYYGHQYVRYAIERPEHQTAPAALSPGRERARQPALSPLGGTGDAESRTAPTGPRSTAEIGPSSPISPEQAAFLEQQRSGRLATVDPRGQPHAVPICYALLGGVLYTPIDEKPKSGDPRDLRRIRNVLANPKVCLVIDHYDDEDWSKLAWLQVRGEASLVEDDAERALALAALRSRYPQYRAMALETLPLLRITPTRLVGWRASDSPRGQP